MGFYRRYRLLLAKEKRMRCAAQREARLNAVRIAELDNRLAEDLADKHVAETDPYCKLEIDH